MQIYTNFLYNITLKIPVIFLEIKKKLLKQIEIKSTFFCLLKTQVILHLLKKKNNLHQNLLSNNAPTLTAGELVCGAGGINIFTCLCALQTMFFTYAKNPLLFSSQIYKRCLHVLRKQ